MPMVAITADEISTLTKYVYALCGVALDASKAYLLESRFKPLLSKYGLSSYMELYQKAVADKSGEMEKDIVSAITTNETLFFRDNSPFEVFKHKILPDIIDARSKMYAGRPIPIRIWSAACSTGQEVYSIAIALIETLGRLDRYQISILGTDISDEAIAKASYGKYNKFEIERGLPMNVLHRYFTSTGDGWRIKDEIRAMAVFKKFNLMKPFTGLGRFDVVFCRNVAIYFTPQDKRAVFEKIAGVLEPDGALIIGSTESLSGVTTMFEPRRYMRAVFYQLAGTPRPAAASTAPPQPAAFSAPSPPRPVSPPRPSVTGASRPAAAPPRGAPASVGPRPPAQKASPSPPPSPGVTTAMRQPTPPLPREPETVAVSTPAPASVEQEAAARPAPPRRQAPPPPTRRLPPQGPPADKVALKKLLMQKKAAKKAGAA
ncbi:MAG: methyltransferase, CheR-type [Desulfomicrobiaceae bacterium]|nr:methyltransferase, CheR-type [Desulfomicrobiaceae bacterium]